MKGVIFTCLKELVEKEFGTDQWAQVAHAAGFDKNARFLPIADVDDALVLKAVDATCEVLSISQQQAADAFGRYWACTYAANMYGAYYVGVTSAKEFLLKLDGIHVATTRAIFNARPPRFTYEDADENSLIMEYHSDRGLMPFFTGLVRGIAEHFNEKADISSLGANKIKIVFSQA